MENGKPAQRGELSGKWHGNRRKRGQGRKLRLEPLESRLLLDGVTYSVTSFKDSGAGSLRDAIEQANASAGADTISFAKGGTIKLLSALPAITDDLAITAAKKVTIDGAGKSSIFSVTGEGTDATFAGLTLTRGFSEEGGAAFLIDAADGVVEISRTAMTKMISSGQDVRGGAISILHGNVTLKDSSISASAATSAEGTAYGGAIFSADTLTVSGSKITKNTATAPNARGGAIFSDIEATLTIRSKSVVDSNTARGIDGARGVNGAKGANGAKGEPGEDGESGGPGEDGTDGGNAGSAIAGGIFHDGVVFTLVESSVSGNLALGGNGGSGGNGGTGGAGGAGGPGYGSGEERTPPGDRGEGGPGGMGGNGGDGGFASAGGIYSGAGSVVTITSSIISKNQANPGKAGLAGKGGAAGAGSGGDAGENGQAGTTGGDPDYPVRGGGILNHGALTITGSQITKNTLSGFVAEGGGIFSDLSLSVATSVIDANKVTGLNGLKGDNGVKGVNGAKGGRGENGEPGEPGTDGADGADGGSVLGGGIFNLGTLELFKSSVSGNILLGGKGGDGGAGGAGGKGGAAGAAVSYDGETYRGEAGYGGDGGSGGNGGSGGAALGGGIYSGPDATTTIRGDATGACLISGNVATAGLAGKGGAGGKGGSGYGGGGISGENGVSGDHKDGSESPVNAQGGGILSRGGLTIEYATISKNAVTGFSAQGGGIAAEGNTTISDSTITLNKVLAVGVGANGSNGAKGMDGARGEPGEDGEDGDDGDDGGDGGQGGSALGGGIFTAGDLTLTRSIISGNTLKAGNGGNGGNGGAGGDGGAGGRAFSDYGTRYPAGKAGYAGSGGDGGNGGAGGNALGAGIYTAEDATTIETSNTIQGNSAIAGLGGKGGKGGAIGKGRKGDALKGVNGDPGAPGDKDA